MQELADLRSAYASLLMHFRKLLQRNRQAQEDFIAFVQELLEGAVSSDCNFYSAFNTFKKEEISLFNIKYLNNVCTILPEEVR